MTEKISINGKDVWIIVEAHKIQRENPKIIPTEYFIAYYTFQEPGVAAGEVIKEKDERPKLFESPVAALEYATEKLSEIVPVD